MAEAFQQRVMGLFESSGTVMGLALGGDLGLFKAMADLNRPFTSEELARATSCKERYIREWLSFMACSDIVGYDTESEKFFVEKEKLSCLSGILPLSVGVVSVIGQRQPLLRECFKLGGPDGIDQNVSNDFGKWLGNVRGGSFEQALECRILGEVPNMKEKLESGITMADVGCGTGLMALMIAERFPNSTVWALDVSEELLNLGRQGAKKKNLQNVHFEYADAHNFSEKWAAKLDYIFCYDVIHDLPFPRVALEQIYKSLKDGGVFSMLEPNVHSSLKDNLEHRHSADTYFFSLYFCLPHSLSVPGGDGWGRTMGEERGGQFVREAGFKDFKVYHDDMNHFVCYK